MPALTALQARKTAEWHEKEFAPTESGLLGVVEEEHRCNFELWHEEDRARRDDQGFEFVYRAKRSIDRWNQRRNDCIEKIDKWLIDRIPPPSGGAPTHSETPGMIIDRLSILALKEYHMAEEALREEAPAEQRATCRHKLEIIRRQRSDLAAALTELLADIASAKRGFRVYYQFKMYNDPSLNPELYRRR
ncbi:MAG: DUF4254 domain-containing protein [Burkholderiales bacterium]